MDEIKDQRASP